MLRKLYLVLFAFAALLFAATTSSQAQTLLTHHVRSQVRSGEARPVGHMAAGQTMSLDLVLPLRDPAGLTAFLKDLYTPGSAVYKQYLTPQHGLDRRSRLPRPDADLSAPHGRPHLLRPG